MQVILQTIGLAPLINLVGWDIRKQHKAFALSGLNPHGAFGPVKAVGELLDYGLARDQLIQGGIETLDFSQARVSGSGEITGGQRGHGRAWWWRRFTAEKEREGGNPKNGGAGYHAKGDDTVVSMARKPKSRLFELQATQGFSVAEIEASLG